MKTLAAVAVGSALMIACSGCTGSMTAPTAPATAAAPRLTTIDAHINGSFLIVDVRTTHPMFDVRAHDLQVYLDSDDNASTGYGAHGDEYVARLIESHDAARFPLRRTEPMDAADPAGWGAVTGFGQVGYGLVGVQLQIPLAAVGGGRGPMLVRVEMYSGGGFDYRDASTDPAPALVTSE
jgi:hypothetical protein